VSEASGGEGGSERSEESGGGKSLLPRLGETMFEKPPTPISFANAQSIDPPHRFAGGREKSAAGRGKDCFASLAMTAKHTPFIPAQAWNPESHNGCLACDSGSPLSRGRTVEMARLDSGSAAHRHSALKTRVNALLALRCVRDTTPVRPHPEEPAKRASRRMGRPCHRNTHHFARPSSFETLPSITPQDEGGDGTR